MKSRKIRGGKQLTPGQKAQLIASKSRIGGVGYTIVTKLDSIREKILKMNIARKIFKIT